MRLFSSFDIIFFNGSIIFFLFFSVLASSFWLLSSFNFFLSFLSSFFFNFFSSINLSKVKLNDSFLFCLFSFIFLINFLSVLGYNFAFSSQVSTCMIMRFSFWISYFLILVFLELKGFLSHCIPEGSPKVLVPFLFAIELVSVMIRPLTLLVRLFANILAGHLLMILLASFVYRHEIFFPFFIFLQMVEFFVSLIQGYIFVTMLSLYYSDLF